MCRTAVSSVDDPMSKGMNMGILFLLAMPFTVVGSIGAGIWWAQHRRKAGGAA